MKQILQSSSPASHEPLRAPLHHPREKYALGALRIVSQNHKLRFTLIIFLLGLSWFLGGAQMLHLLTPEELAYRVVHVITRYSYITFLVFMILLMIHILWIELRGIVNMKTVDEEHLDVVERKHPYIPEKKHVIFSVLLMMTFPVFMWQAHAQIAAITEEEEADPFMLADTGSGEIMETDTEDIAWSGSGVTTGSGMVTGSGAATGSGIVTGPGALETASGSVMIAGTSDTGSTLSGDALIPSDTASGEIVIATTEGTGSTLSGDVIIPPETVVVENAEPIEEALPTVELNDPELFADAEQSLELTPLADSFDAHNGAKFRLADVDLSVDAEEGDRIDTSVAQAALIRNFLTEEQMRKTIIQSLITKQAANIAEKVLSDSTTAQDVRNDLEEGGSVKRSGLLEESVINTITNNNAAQKDLVAIAAQNTAVANAVTSLITSNTVDVVAAAIANHEDPAEAIASTLGSTTDATEAVGNALSQSNDTAQTIVDHADQTTHAAVTPPLLQVLLTDSKGNTIVPKYHFQKGSVVLVLEPERAFTPGVYTLIVTITNPLTGEAQSFSQDFAWGVLALNPDKDTYEEGDDARIDIGVLDNHGDIVCDADISLTVTSPSGDTLTLKTEPRANTAGSLLRFLSSILSADLLGDFDQVITTTGSCGKKVAGFIDPDFTTNIHLDEKGTYTLDLTATTTNGERSLQSTLTVADDRPFLIKRTAATRLWPFAPSPMTLDVTFNQDFNGDISDIVPDGFEIVVSEPEAEITHLDDGTTQVIWHGIDAHEGDSKTFSYSYDAPDISPQFYLMGPLAIGEQSEGRAWQIANDASKTWDGGGVDNNCSTDANWNGDTKPVAGDDITFNSTSTKNITWDASCPSTVASFTVSNGYTGTGTFAGTFMVTGDMTVGSGTLVTAQAASGAIKVNGNFTMGRGSKLIVRYSTLTGGGSGQLLAVAGNMIVGTGATITGDVQGFAGSAGPGVGAGFADGGSHGGVGGDYAADRTTNSSTYGSFIAPTSLGSGAQGAAAGGGAARFVVSGRTTVYGLITMNGEVGGNRAGAGGSVFITTGTFTGSGTIRANGASGGNEMGGGGGRVAVVLTSTNANFSSYFGTISAYGGNTANYDGAAGTVYKEEEADAAGAGEVIIDNSNATPPGHVTTVIPSGQTWTVNDLTLQNKGVLGVSTGSVLVLSNDTVVSDTDDRTDGIRLAGGVMTLSSGTLTIDEWGLIADTRSTLTGSVIVASGGLITHSDNTTGERYKINLTVTSNFTLQTGGAINVDYLGYDPSNGPGTPTNGSADGASHGGMGGDFITNGTALPNTYGSFIAPTNLGSGADANGGNGGGAVQLTIGGLCTISGTISANGLATGNRSGAGGSIYITTATIAGAGTVRANGGDGSQMGGGGGRVAIILTGNGADFSSYSATTSAYGGDATSANSDGAAGTVYKQTKAQGSGGGQLLIANFSTASVVSNVATVLDGTSARSATAGSLIVSNLAKFVIGENDVLTLAGTGTTILLNSSTSLVNGGRLNIGGTGAVVRSGGLFTMSGATNWVSYTGQSNNAAVTVYPTTYRNFGINKSNTTFTVSGTTLKLSTTGALIITGGTLSMNNKNLTVAGTFTNKDTIAFKGSETVSYTNDTSNNGTVVYNGTGSYASLAGGNSYANLSLNNGLIAYWKLDEGTGSTTARDVSGNGNTATRTIGSSVIPSWSASLPTTRFKNSKSMYFNGAGGCLQIAPSPKLETIGKPNTKWTVAFNMKPTSSSVKTLFYFSPTTSPQVIRIDTQGTNVSGLAYDGTNLPQATASISLNTWSHVAVVYDHRPGGSICVYVNGGAPTCTTDTTGSSDLSTGTLSPTIGAWNSCTQLNYQGYLDDIRIYDRALTRSETQSLANGYQETGSGTYGLNSTLSVNGNMSILAGILSPGSNSVGVGGNWANYGGFTKGTSTVTFNGSGNQTVSGSTLFHNFTKIVSSAKTLFFDYLGQQSASGTLTLKGAIAGNLSIRSTRSGSGAALIAGASTTQSVRYLDVQDSNAGAGTAIGCLVGCTNTSNNTNWTFGTTKTWDGGGANNNCSTAANWSGDTVPDSTTNVVFDDTSTKNVTWDASCTSTVASFTVDNGYTGTGTFAGKFTVTGDLTVNSGSLVTAQGASGSIKVNGNMAMGRGSRIVVRYSTTTGGGSGQLIAIAGNLTMSTGSIISGDLQGFASNGPGAPPSLNAAAAHGGIGGGVAYGIGATYGSIKAPTSLGSATWGPGGGAIMLRVDQGATINGIITVKGFAHNSGSAGGSIWIRSATIGGSGSLIADGGGSTNTGGGGGGRIAVILSSGTSFGSVNMHAFGGGGIETGAAGTIYTETATQSASGGVLTINNNNYTPPSISTTRIRNGGTIRLSSVVFSNKGALELTSGATLSVPTLTVGTGGKLVVNQSATLSGNLVIGAGGMLTHSSNASTQIYRINLTLLGNLTVNSKGYINVDSQGYPASDVGPGAAISTNGACHGGQGGVASGLQCATYGSITAPITIGSSGWGNGAGAIQLNVSGTTTVNGTVTATPPTVTGGGGGAGGSVYLTTQALTGTGTIRADGGVTTNIAGGGGGRVAIILTGVSADFSQYSGTISAKGGLGGNILWNGAAGTIYKKTTAQTYGDLIVDNANNTTAAGMNTTLNDLSSTGVTINSLTVRNFGKLVIGGNDTVNVVGNGTAILVNSGSRLINGNSLTIAGTGASIRPNATFASSGSFATVTYLGQSNDADVSIGSGSYVNLGFNNPGTAFKLPSKQAIMNVAGNLTITGGTLVTTNGNTLSLSGSWLNNGGTFSAGTGTVALKGTANALTLKESSSFNNLTLNNGLVGYWRFDDGTGSTIARDSSGNRFNGTLTNGPTWSTDLPSVRYDDRSSMNFDGSNDYVSITDDSALTPSAITISAWVKVNALTAGIQYFINKRAGADASYQLYVRSDGALTFSVFNESVGAGNLTAGTLPTGTWAHIAGTWDNATVRLYLNGAQIGSTPRTGTMLKDSNTALTIGAALGGSILDGKVDDVRIYSRALSASEIARLAAGYIDTGSGTYTLANPLDVNGNLNNITGILDPSVSNYGINIGGNLLNIGGFNKRSGAVTLDGSGNQTISGSTVFNNLSVTAAAARTVFFDYTSRQSASGALTIQGASTANRIKLRSTRSGSGAALLLDGDSGTQTLSYIDAKDNNASGGATLACSLGCFNSGNNTNWSFPWSGTVYTDEGNTNIGANKTVAISINGGVPTTTETNASGQFQITTAAPAVGDIVSVYLDDEPENAAIITRTDGVSLSPMDLYQNHLIVRHETGSEITTAALVTAAAVADTDLTDFYTTSNSSIVMTLGTELYVWSGSTLHPGGTLAPDDLDVRGSLAMGGKTLSISGSARTRIGSVTATGTTTFDSASSEFIAFSGSTLSTLNFTGGGTYTASGTLRVNSSLRIQSGVLDLAGNHLNTTSATFRNDDRLRLHGNEVLTGFTNDTSSGTIIFNGASSYSGFNGLTSFKNLTLSGAGTWTLNAAITTNGTLTLSGGTLDTSASNYGISTRSFIARSSAQFNPRRGTVTFNGTGTLASNRAFSGVLLNARGKTLSLGSNTFISGNLTLSGGTLKVPAAATYPIALSGTWLKKANGTFSAGSGTVILDSGTNQTLSGSTTFYKLTKQVSTASNLYLAATTTQTIASTLTLNGAAGQNLTLRSTIAGVQAKLDPQSTRVLQYLTPTDNNNINATIVLCSNDCVNGNGNTNWAFPISVTVYDSDGNIMGAGVTVSIAVNGDAGTTETAITGSDGSATFTGTSVESGDIVTAWIDGENEKGVNISKTNGTSLGFTIYQDTVQVSNEAGSSIKFSDIGTGTLVDGDDISDLVTTGYSAGSGHTLTMADLSTLRIKDGSTLEANGTGDVYTVDIDGTFTMGDWSHVIRGSFDATGGSFTTSGNVIFKTDRPQTITSNGSTFHDVTFAIPHEGANGTWVATDELTITSTQTITITNDVSNFNGPNISNISVTASDLEATISWNTSQLATTKLFMGTSTGTLTEVVNDPAMEYEHSETIGSLTPATKYYYQIVAVNNINQTTTGSVFSFNTLGEQLTQDDLDAAAASAGGGGSTTPNTCTVRWLTIDSLVVIPKSDGTATVTWNTNAAGVSMVNFGINDTKEAFVNDLSTFSLEHSLQLSSLKKGGKYKLKAFSVDKCGNIAESEEVTFIASGTDTQTSSSSTAEEEESSEEATTENVESLQERLQNLLEKLSQNVSLQEFKNTLLSQSELLDSLAEKIPGPVLGGEPKVVPSDTTATITWTTDELADSHISFAPDSLFEPGSYAASVEGENDQITDHSVTLRGLTPGTLYHYQVKSQTPFGTSTVSRDFTFTTQQELITVINYTVEVVSKTSAQFIWSTNVPTTSIVTQTPYRNNNLDRDGEESTKDDTLALRHSVTINNLEPGVVYDIELSGKNAAGIIVSKVLSRFTTSPEESAPEISQVQTDAAIVPGKDSKIQTVISWQTNEQATSRVWYQKGVNTDPTQSLQDSTILDINYTRKHVVLLPSLEPGEIYSFRVESIDSGGNLTLSKTYTILTPRQQEGIIQIIFKQMEEAFGWLKDLRG